jgi:hypothetical protein
MKLNQFYGDSSTFTIPLEWDDAGFTPGSDWHLIFTAKAKRTDPDDAALIQKATGAGITHSGTNALVALVPQDTRDIDAITIYWDIQAQHLTTAEVRTPARGTLKFSRDITRQTEVSIPIHTENPATVPTQAQVIAALGFTPADADDIPATPADLGAEPAQTPATQAESEAGTETGLRSFSPLRIKQAITAHVEALTNASVISAIEADPAGVRAAAKVPASDTTGIAGSDAVTNIVSLTQAAYDAIANKSASTLYVIK